MQKKLTSYVRAGRGASTAPPFQSAKSPSDTPMRAGSSAVVTMVPGPLQMVNCPAVAPSILATSSFARLTSIRSVLAFARQTPLMRGNVNNNPRTRTRTQTLMFATSGRKYDPSSLRIVQWDSQPRGQCDLDVIQRELRCGAVRPGCWIYKMRAHGQQTQQHRYRPSRQDAAHHRRSERAPRHPRGGPRGLWQTQGQDLA